MWGKSMSYIDGGKAKMYNCFTTCFIAEQHECLPFDSVVPVPGVYFKNIPPTI